MGILFIEIISSWNFRFIEPCFKWQMSLMPGEYDNRGDRHNRKASNHKEMSWWRHPSYRQQMPSHNLQNIKYMVYLIKNMAGVRMFFFSLKLVLSVKLWWLTVFLMSFEKSPISQLTHHGPVTQYCGGSTLCKNPIFFIMKEFPQIFDAVIF